MIVTYVGRAQRVSARPGDRRRGTSSAPPAVVLWVGDDAWTVTGFETDSLTRKAVAQSWYVSFSEV